MKKLRVEEVIVVEGKYDAAKLADLVDGLILTTNGFSVFKNADIMNAKNVGTDSSHYRRWRRFHVQTVRQRLTTRLDQMKVWKIF